MLQKYKWAGTQGEVYRRIPVPVDSTLDPYRIVRLKDGGVLVINTARPDNPLNSFSPPAGSDMPQHRGAI